MRPISLATAAAAATRFAAKHRRWTCLLCRARSRALPFVTIIIKVLAAKPPIVRAHDQQSILPHTIAFERQADVAHSLVHPVHHATEGTSLSGAHLSVFKTQSLRSFQLRFLNKRHWRTLACLDRAQNSCSCRVDYMTHVGCAPLGSAQYTQAAQPAASVDLMPRSRETGAERCPRHALPEAAPHALAATPRCRCSHPAAASCYFHARTAQHGSFVLSFLMLVPSLSCMVKMIFYHVNGKPNDSFLTLSA